jgi:proline iminopeptidase
MRISINGNELEAHVQGDPTAPVLIAHHGGPGVSDHTLMTNSFAAFADRFRVITFDLRGNGVSGDNPPYTHEQWAADIDGLREWAGVEQIVMAGHSYGGVMALEYVTRYPERVRALMLCDTAADGAWRVNCRKQAELSDRVTLDMERFDRTFAGQARDDDDLREAFRAILPLYSYVDDRTGLDELVNSVVIHHRTHNFAFSNNLPGYDVTDQLSAISCPTLVVVGREDWITPVSESEKLAAAIPDAQLTIFERSGHSPMSDEPELWRTTIADFLTRACPDTNAAVAG